MLSSYSLLFSAAFTTLAYLLSKFRPISMSLATAPATRDEWRKALADLPATPNNIPAIFLAHGQPMIAWPESLPPPSDPRFGPLWTWGGRDGPLGQFLVDLGPVLLEKYQPKGVVVFSAHWETDDERHVTDYGEENPLLMDYYGFNPELYKLEFHSRGDSSLTERIIGAFKKAGQSARATKANEPRGLDGRPSRGGRSPGPGLDHGVFVPFLRMWGEKPTVPIVEVSIDSNLDPEGHWEIGKALSELRTQGYLIISGGLVVHTFEDFGAFANETAKPVFKEWHADITKAVQVEDPIARKAALLALTRHPTFQKAHPREEHFIPLYVAAGAGDGPNGSGKARVLADIYGQSTFAFGL